LLTFDEDMDNKMWEVFGTQCRPILSRLQGI